MDLKKAVLFLFIIVSLTYLYIFLFKDSNVFIAYLTGTMFEFTTISFIKNQIGL